MSRRSKPITVTVGDLAEAVQDRVRSGAYASSSEVIRAALRALQREEAALDDLLRRRVEEAFADPRPEIPAQEVFQHLRQHHARRLRSAAKTSK